MHKNDDTEETTHNTDPAHFTPETSNAPNMLNTPAASGMSSPELEELADSECVCQNGLESTVELPDKKCVHKGRVLQEFTKYSKASNSTNHLQ